MGQRKKRYACLLVLTIFFFITHYYKERMYLDLFNTQYVR